MELRGRLVGGAMGWLFFGLAVVLSAAPAAPVNDPGALRAAQSKLAELAAKLPLRFEPNVGQVKDAEVRYFARGRGYRLSLGAAEAVFSLGDARPGKARAGEKTVRLRLAGAAERPVLEGIDPLPTKSNYFRGNDRRAWRTGVASFGGVRYEKVYPGTDLVFSGNDHRVEQSFFLAAGAEPRRIRLVYEGAAAAEVGGAGELILRTPGGELTADRPVAYQVAGGERRPVECRYELLAAGKGAPVVGFALGAYDRGLPLVIDPVFSNGMTPLNGAGNDIGHAIAVDGAGNVYVAGSTSSTDFIGTVAPGGVQPASAGEFDGFVAKIDPTGTTLLYSTYLGGSGTDEVEGIAVDAAGNAYVTGYTLSSDFPGVTPASLQSASGGGRDAFVAKLSPTGAALLYSTYLGGSGSDSGNGIAVDSSGNAYVTGSTGSGNFPGVTAASLQPANAGGEADAFVTKIGATGGAIVYSTYLGGSADDQATHIAVDAAGGAVIVGGTCSAAFPVTAGALAPASPGVDCGGFLYDAFAARLNPAGTALVYSTYLGGAGNDIARGVALDAAGNAYVAGYTDSDSFTGVTAGSFQPAHPAGYAAFLTKINAAGTAAVYSTFLGGGGSYGWGVAVDTAANAYVTGDSDAGYPVVNAGTLDPTFSGFAPNPFVTKVDATGAVRYSTYVAGPTATGYAVAVDSARKTVFVTGARSGSGGGDAFLVRIAPSAVLSITKAADVSTVDPGNKITYTLTYQNYGEARRGRGEPGRDRSREHHFQTDELHGRLELLAEPRGRLHLHAAAGDGGGGSGRHGDLRGEGEDHRVVVGRAHRQQRLRSARTQLRVRLHAHHRGAHPLDHQDGELQRRQAGQRAPLHDQGIQHGQSGRRPRLRDRHGAGQHGLRPCNLDGGVDLHAGQLGGLRLQVPGGERGDGRARHGRLRGHPVGAVLQYRVRPGGGSRPCSSTPGRRPSRRYALPRRRR